MSVWYKPNRAERRRRQRIVRRTRRCVGSLALAGAAVFAMPRQAHALHPPPTFAAAVTNPFSLADVGDYASPSFADLDGDGDLDAFIGESNGATKYFENTGTAIAPAFAAAVDNPFSLADADDYASPSFADLDGDGDLDAFIGELEGNTKYFENTGTAIAPAFAAAVTNPFSLAAVEHRASPSFADLDGDGDLDAFIGNYDGNTKYFENTGTAMAPAFAAAVTNPFSLADVGGYATPSFADLDGDGDLDAFIANGSGDTKYFENTGTTIAPAFAAAVDNPFSLANANDYASPSFADLDGDGDLDAFIGEAGGNTKYFENTRGSASPAFAAVVENPFSLTGVVNLCKPNFADLDGDGDLDAFLGEVNGATKYFENTGTVLAPAFAAAVDNPFALASVASFSSPSFVDLDCDGDFDAFIGDIDGNTKYFENTGTAIAPAFAAVVDNPFSLADVGHGASVSFADLDGDGDLDAFIAEHYGNTKYFENTGTAIAPAFASVVTNPFSLTDVGNYASPSFADLDGDGDLDAFIGNTDGNTKYFENTGTATAPAFAAGLDDPFSLADVGNRASPSFTDLDGDGDLDAFIGNSDGNTKYFENTTPVPVELSTFSIE